MVLREASIDKPGSYKVVASDGTRRSEVTWTVFATGPRVAKNVILFIGDGMSMANRTAARILSKGIKEGKYFGKLAMDDMPHMALVGTSGVDAITTDSANSMSAYTTGHKSSVNALGVYAARNKNNLEHPKVETIVELAKRKLDLAVAGQRCRGGDKPGRHGARAESDKPGDHPRCSSTIASSLMGGVRPGFSPKSTPGSKRKDDKNWSHTSRPGLLVTTVTSLTTTAADLRR